MGSFQGPFPLSSSTLATNRIDNLQGKGEGRLPASEMQQLAQSLQISYCFPGPGPFILNITYILIYY